MSTPIGDEDTNMADAAEKGMDQSRPSEPVKSPGKKKGSPEGEGDRADDVDEFDAGDWGLTAASLDRPFAEAAQTIKDNLGAFMNMETD